MQKNNHCYKLIIYNDFLSQLDDLKHIFQSRNPGIGGRSIPQVQSLITLMVAWDSIAMCVLSCVNKKKLLIDWLIDVLPQSNNFWTYQPQASPDIIFHHVSPPQSAPPLRGGSGPSVV